MSRFDIILLASTSSGGDSNVLVAVKIDNAEKHKTDDNVYKSCSCY